MMKAKIFTGLFVAALAITNVFAADVPAQAGAQQSPEGPIMLADNNQNTTTPSLSQAMPAEGSNDLNAAPVSPSQPSQD